MNIKNQIKKRSKHFSRELNKALEEEFLSFEQTQKIDAKGVYFIFDNTDDLFYIGMTNREGKARIKELASDFRSHTFNKRVLKQRIEESLKIKLKIFNNNSKKLLIENKQISSKDFSNHQKFVNIKIKEKLRYRFFKTDEPEALEQYAIAILQPLFNGK